VAYSYTLNATDAEGDALTYSLSNAPSWLTLSASGVLSGTPPAVATEQGIQVTVSDSNGGSASIIFSIEVTAAAVAGGGTTGTGGGGGSLPLSLLAVLLGLGLRRRSNT